MSRTRWLPSKPGGSFGDGTHLMARLPSEQLPPLRAVRLVTLKVDLQQLPAARAIADDKLERFFK